MEKIYVVKKYNIFFRDDEFIDFNLQQNKCDLANDTYYLKLIEKGDIDAICKLGNLYFINDKNDLAEKYYLMAIEKGNIDAMNNLGLLFKTQKKYDIAEKYYLMAAEKDNVRAMNNLGLLYEKQKGQYDIAEKYYLMAIEKGDVNAMNNLAFLYNKQKKYDDIAEKYYLMAIEKGDPIAMNNLARFVGELKLYNCLVKLQQKSEIVNIKIDELKKTREIHCFENKKNFLSKTDTCPICFENTLLIPKECTHFYCCDCYIKFNKCSICQF